MFDIQSLPGEAFSAIDWTRLQRDFDFVCAERCHAERVKTESGGVAATPMYPIFEVAVWELDALQHLLVALDQRHAALESNLNRGGAERKNARLQLEQTENALCEARAEFIEEFQQLKRDGNDTSSSAESAEASAFAALNALWELEAVWRSHRPRANFK